MIAKTYFAHNEHNAGSVPLDVVPFDASDPYVVEERVFNTAAERDTFVAEVMQQGRERA